MAKREEKMATAKEETNRTHMVPSDLGFDPNALRRKYRQEREERPRLDDKDRYAAASGQLAHFIERALGKGVGSLEPSERDETRKLLADVTMEGLIADWKANT